MKQKITIAIISLIAGTFLTGTLSAQEKATIKVDDDGYQAVETIAVTFTEDVAVETRMTLNDTTSELASIDRQITVLQARRVEVLTHQANIQAEIDKRPARKVVEVEEIIEM